ncbi:aminopeptidase P family protein [Haloterrigena sp. SYSU A558-1]|uniref:Aminopeptidase P family protein n=1 Tax=Haloterrigena gelatinilytica TaxID=2741724 RepID=A0A8J8KIA3_9EURY|nr:aminopeptidase P family protein [Haloterrigena gelatinilytica]NUB93912.1 aminopeptidase P family protein [Haloterrigena gelatinilytica]NUC74838.1 aminopeptidase P family protein [Haloterrigena gelatinilytica]
MRSPFERRLEACQRRLERVDAALAALVPGPNLTYLTGFEESPSERHLLLFVPRVGDPVVVAPAMYDAQLRTLPIETLAVRLWDDDDDPLEEIEAVLAELLPAGDGDPGSSRDGDAPTILVDDRMWATFTQDLRACAPAATFDLASRVLEDLRIRKDDVELEALRRAGEIADRVSLEIRSRGTELVGRTEAELASEIERLLAEYGGGDPAFETIVASGPNGARPHHHSGDREIERGDPIVLDFGAFVDADLEDGTGRYPGDQTRTIVVGDAPGDEYDRYERVHEVVREAHRAAVEAVEPGATAGAVDRAARSVIEDAGYGDEFVHRTGHGVGLEVHEPPYIVADNDRKLEPGMVFSVEPGIYLEGEFGVRIEDLVVVTEDGAERLNESPRGWETGSGVQ